MAVWELDARVAELFDELAVLHGRRTDLHMVRAHCLNGGGRVRSPDALCCTGCTLHMVCVRVSLIWHTHKMYI